MHVPAFSFSRLDLAATLATSAITGICRCRRLLPRFTLSVFRRAVRSRLTEPRTWHTSMTNEVAPSRPSLCRASKPPASVKFNKHVRWAPPPQPFATAEVKVVWERVFRIPTSRQNASHSVVVSPSVGLQSGDTSICVISLDTIGYASASALHEIARQCEGRTPCQKCWTPGTCSSHASLTPLPLGPAAEPSRWLAKREHALRWWRRRLVRGLV